MEEKHFLPRINAVEKRSAAIGSAPDDPGVFPDLLCATFCVLL
jgi:hypothetical protein